GQAPLLLSQACLDDSPAPAGDADRRLVDLRRRGPVEARAHGRISPGAVEADTLTNPRRVSEIRRPRWRANFGTECFQARFVSWGMTKTVPELAGKSRVIFRPRCVSRNIRPSPKEMVTMGAPEAMPLL